PLKASSRPNQYFDVGLKGRQVRKDEDGMDNVEEFYQDSIPDEEEYQEQPSYEQVYYEERPRVYSPAQSFASRPLVARTPIKYDRPVVEYYEDSFEPQRIVKRPPSAKRTPQTRVEIVRTPRQYVEPEYIAEKVVYRSPGQRRVSVHPDEYFDEPVYEETVRSPVYEEQVRSPVYEEQVRSPIYEEPRRTTIYEETRRTPVQRDIRRKTLGTTSRKTPLREEISVSYNEPVELPEAESNSSTLREEQRVHIEKPQKKKSSKQSTKPSKTAEKQREKPKKVSKPVQEEPVERPSVSDDGLRRSHRTKLPPLKFWANERVVYARRDSGIHVVKAIRVESEDEGAVIRPKKKVRVKEEKHQVPPEVEVFNHAKQTEDMQNMVQPAAVGAGEYKFQKIFSEGEFIASGVLVLPRGVKKPTKNSHESAMVSSLI
ncbi:hypothetical protein EDD86DRAFT_209980, partial [Gorgonomyces haynaldii]